MGGGADEANVMIVRGPLKCERFVSSGKMKVEVLKEELPATRTEDPVEKETELLETLKAVTVRIAPEPRLRVDSADICNTKEELG